MSVYILGGVAKGHPILVPKGEKVRPTQVMLKRKIFDSFQSFEDSIFIDACAGSGSIGLEAWSRGAKKVFFVEPDRKVLSVLRKNVTKFKESYPDHGKDHEIIVSSNSILKWIKVLRERYEEYSEEEKRSTILFLDPPYKMIDIYKEIVFKRLISESWFKGELWIESDRHKGLPISYWEEQNVESFKTTTHGDSYIYYVRF